MAMSSLKFLTAEQINAMVMATEVSAPARAVALHHMAISVHNLAVEEAATFAEELVAQLCPANDHHSPREIADRIRAKLLRAP